MKLFSQPGGVDMTRVRLLAFFVSLAVLSFSTIYPQFFEFTSGIVLMAMVLIQFALYGVEVVLGKKMSCTVSALDVAVIFGLVCTAFAHGFSQGNLVGWIGSYRFFTTSVLHTGLLALLYFVTKDLFARTQISRVFAGSVIALTPSLVYFLLSRIITVPQLTDSTFSGFLITLLFVVVGTMSVALMSHERLWKLLAGILCVITLIGIIVTQLPFSFVIMLFLVGASLLLWSAFDEMGKSQKLILWSTLGLAVLTIIVNYFGTLFISTPKLVDVVLPHFSGVEIAQSVFAVHPWVGVGLNHFTDAFYLYYPTTLGISIFDGQVFTSSSSHALQLLTTNGVIGLVGFYITFVVAFFSLIVALRKEIKQIITSHSKLVTLGSLFVALLALTLASIVYPLTTLHLVLVVILFGMINACIPHKTITVELQRTSQVLVSIVGTLIILTGIGAVSAYAYAHSNVIRALQEKGHISERAYAIADYDSYVTFQYGVDTLAQVQTSVSEEEAKEKVQKGIAVLQTLATAPELTYDVAVGLSYIAPQLAQLTGQEIIDEAALVAKVNPLFPNNPQVIIGRVISALQVDGILDAEGNRDLTFKPKQDATSSAHVDIDLFQKYKPLAFEGYFAKGLAYEVDGELQKAYDAYAKSLSISPTQQEVVYSLAQVLIELEQKDEARMIIERYLSDNPEDEKLLELQKVLSTK